MPLIAQAEELCGLHDHITRVITHLIPKRKYEAEIEDIEEIEREAVTGVGVVRHVPHGNEGQIHTESIMYVPSTKEDRHHAVFTTNRDVPLDMVPGFTGQYTQRWQIENEYKSIKIC